MGYQHGRTGTGNPLSNNSPLMYAICTFKSRFIALISERRLEKNAISPIPICGRDLDRWRRFYRLRTIFFHDPDGMLVQFAEGDE